MNALSKVTYGGQVADLADALTLAQTVFSPACGARQGVNKVAVVITSNPSASQSATLTAAAALRNAGVGVVTVGVGSNLNLYELSAACTYPPSANMFKVGSATNVPTLAVPVQTILCSREFAIKRIAFIF